MTDVNQDLEFIMRAQDRATDVIDRVEGRLGGLGSRLSRVSEIAGGFIMGQGLMRLGDTLMGVVSSGIAFNSSMEQNSIAFTTMLGSADAAKEHLEELINFAKNTPFEQRDVIEGSKRLQAFGFEAEKIIPTLTAVGDAAAGLGMGGEGVNRIIYALGQMRAKAKVSGEEMMQLTEAGIPAWELLAKKMGKTVPELMDMSQKGIIPVKEALDGLITGMGERFPNMMEKQSKSFQGMMSTVKDTIAIAAGKFMKPIFSRLQSGMTQVLNFLSTGTFERIIDVIANGLGGAVDFVANGVSNLGSALSPIVGLLGRIINAVGNFRSYLSSENEIDLMGRWFGPDFGPRIDEVIRSVKNLLGMIGMVFNDIRGVLSGDIGIETLRTKVAIVVNNIGSEMSRIGTQINDYISSIDWGLTAEWIRNGLTNAFIQATSGIAEVLGRVGDIAGAIGEWLGGQWSRINWGFVWSKVSGFATGINDMVADINWELAWSRVTGFTNGLLKKFSGLSNSVTIALTGVFGQVDWIKIWQEVTGLAEGLSDRIRSVDWSETGIALGEALKVVLPTVIDMALSGAELAGKLTVGFAALLGNVNWEVVAKAVVPAAVGFALGVVSALLDPMVWWEIVSKHWLTILTIIVTVIAAPEAWLARIGAGLAKIPLIGRVLEWLFLEFSGLLKGFWNIVGPILDDMGGAFIKGFLDILRVGGRGGGLLAGLRGVIKVAVDGIVDFGETFYLRALMFMENMGKAIAEHGPKQVVDAVRNILGKVDDFFVETVPKWFSRAVELGKGIINGIRQGLRSINLPMPDIRLGWQEIEAFGGKISIPKLDIGVIWKALGDLIPGLAKGGYARSSGSVLVGEDGPEILNMPRGASVVPLHNGQQFGGNTIVISVSGNTLLGRDSDIARQLWDIIEPEYRRKVSYAT